MTFAARELGFRILEAIGAAAVGRWRNRHAAVVLTYHAVTEVDPSLYQRFPLVYANATSSEGLQVHLAHLKRHYHLLDAEEFLDCLGRGRFPHKSAMLTFDDGLRCHAKIAGPLLASEGAPGVAFLPTGMIDAATEGQVGWQWTDALAALVYARGTALRAKWTDARAHLGPVLPELRRDATDEDMIQSLWAAFWKIDHAGRSDAMHELAALSGGLPDPAEFPADRHGTSVLSAMSWPEARALASERVELGGHSVHHSLMSELPAHEAEREILECAERTTQMGGRPTRLFSYPYGVVGKTAPPQDVFRRAGIRAAFTQRYGPVAPAGDPYLLPRIDLPGGSSEARLAYYASGLRKLTA